MEVKGTVTLVFLLSLACLGLIFLQGGKGETIISTDSTVETELVFSNETILMRANITVVGNGSLRMNDCIVICGIPAEVGPVRFLLLENASLIIEGSRFSTADEVSRYYLQVSSRGRCTIRDSSFGSGGGTVSDQRQTLSIQYADFYADNVTMVDFHGGFLLADCAAPIIDGLTTIHGSDVALELRRCIGAKVMTSRFLGEGPKIGLGITECTDLSIGDTTFEGMVGGSGIAFATGLTPGQSNQRVLVMNCSFIANGCAVDQFGGRESLLEGCRFVRNVNTVTICNSGMVPPPAIIDCQFKEDRYAISTATHQSSEGPLVIRRCAFSLSTIAVFVQGRNWTLEGCIFEYCRACVFTPQCSELHLIGNSFLHSIYQSINYDMTPDEDVRDLLDMRDNVLSGGSAIACRLLFYGKAIISNNTFSDLSGGGLRLTSMPHSLLLQGNLFSNCSVGIIFSYDRFVLDPNVFRGCQIAIQSIQASVRVVGGVFERSHMMISSEQSTYEIAGCRIDGDCSMIFNRSVVDLSTDLDLSRVRLRLENGSFCKVLDNPSTGRSVWYLDGNSTLELRNCSVPLQYGIMDDASSMRIYWPVVVSVHWMSDGLPVRDVAVTVRDRDLDTEGTAITASTGTTPPLALISEVRTRAGTEGWQEHLLQLHYLRWDLSANESVNGPSSFSFLLDDIAPEIVFTAPVAGSLLATSTLVVEGECSDGSRVVALSLTIDGGEPVALLPISPWRAIFTTVEGSHRIDVEARDEFGNAASASISIIVDLSPPIIMLTQPRPGQILNGTRTIVSGLTEPQALIRCGDVSCFAGANGSFELDVPLVQEGVQDLVVTGTDRAGHSIAVKTTIVVDWTPPRVEFENLTALTNLTSLPIQGRTSEPVRELLIGGMAVRIGAAMTFRSSLVIHDGANLVHWGCVDLAGNRAEGVLAITVDRTNNLTILRPRAGDTVRLGVLEIAGNTDPGSQVLEEGSGLATVADAGGNFTLSIWSGGTGQATIRLRSIDRAGNLAEETVDYSVFKESPDQDRLSIWIFYLAILIILVVAAVSVIPKKKRRG